MTRKEPNKYSKSSIYWPFPNKPHLVIQSNVVRSTLSSKTGKLHMSWRSLDKRYACDQRVEILNFCQMVIFTNSRNFHGPFLAIDGVLSDLCRPIYYRWRLQYLQIPFRHCQQWCCLGYLTVAMRMSKVVNSLSCGGQKRIRIDHDMVSTRNCFTTNFCICRYTQSLSWK